MSELANLPRYRFAAQTSPHTHDAPRAYVLHCFGQGLCKRGCACERLETARHATQQRQVQWQHSRRVLHACLEWLKHVRLKCERCRGKDTCTFFPVILLVLATGPQSSAKYNKKRYAVQITFLGHIQFRYLTS